MPYCPCEHTKNNNYYSNRSELPTPNSYIRAFHASPSTPAVDVYANGNLIIKNLAYKQLSPYVPVIPGTYNIKIYPAGTATNPVIDTTVNVPENTILNLAIIGKLPNLSIFPIPEPIVAQDFGRACIRFIHLSPTAPKVDISLTDGTKVFNNVGFKDITDYACIPAGTYSFNVIPSGTTNTILTIPNIQLASNNYYTLYALGDVNGNPPLEALLVTEPR